jgi:hypothetical protein
MSVRVQVILDEAERDEMKRLARSQGLSSSAWLREAGRLRAEAVRAKKRFTSVAELEHFFATRDERESGREPDWAEHLRVAGSGYRRNRVIFVDAPLLCATTPGGSCSRVSSRMPSS